MLQAVRQGRLRALCCGAARALSSSTAAGQQAAAAAADTIEVFVNDEPVTIPKGSSVLQACDAAGIDIPRHAALVCCVWHTTAVLPTHLVPHHHPRGTRTI